LCLALACAAPPPLAPGESAKPALGDPLALLVTKLHHADGTPAKIDLRELRAMSVASEPWQPLEIDVAAFSPGEVGVIAGRRCSWREGLDSEQVDRGSWFLLRDGRLSAFDHPGFGAYCARDAAFEPAAADQVEIERSLRRYLSQRWPPGEIPGEERLARGLRLLEVDRPEDARYELIALDRRLTELERRQTEQETPDIGQRERLREEEERLRPLRAQLFHALRDDAKLRGELP
jgi:hypothetical protein